MIGKWIKESREGKGLSQNQLAELMCTTRQCISHYENGRRQSPSLEVLKEFSRVLDLTILIEKGEVIKMNKETGVVQTIESVRERLERQFKYTSRITIQELVGQILELVEGEFNVDAPTWRGFFPKGAEPYLVDASKEDWVTFFSHPEWGRWEFDIEIGDIDYIQGVTFKIEEPQRFVEIMTSYLPQTDEEWESFSEMNLWSDVVCEAIYDSYYREVGNLIISDIQIER